MPKQKRHAMIPFEKIIVDKKFNSRKTYTGIETLAESITNHGLLQDLGGKYNSSGEQFHLTVGFRRYYAIQHIRDNLNPDAFNEVPVVIHDVSLDELKLRNLAENIDREQLSSAEVADYIVKLVNTGLDQRTIAKRLGRPQSWVSYHYKVRTKLSPKAWQAFEANDITLDNALYVADLPAEEQPALVKQVKNADTRKEAKELAKAASKKSGKRRAYINKGRPSARNLCTHVDEVSFKATDANLSPENVAFYNGMAAAFRVALGDTDYAKVTMDTDFFDTDFSGKEKAAKEKATRKPKKKRKKTAK